MEKQGNTQMTNKAKIYVACVVATGLMALMAGLYRWESPDLQRYFSYLALAIFASTLKIKLPGITGTFSLNFLFILIGIAHFSFAETVTMACAAAAVQCLWGAKQRSKLIQVLFNVANLAISAGASYSISHFALTHGLSNMPALLSLAACIFFVTNTVLISGVLSLVETKPLKKVWQQWFLWSFPYYLAGAVLAGLFSMSTPTTDWKTPLLLLPMMYLIYFYYHLYVERQTSGAMISQEIG